MTVLLEDFIRKRRENTFKPTVGNESLHQDSNDNGVRIVNFATSKNLVMSTMFPHHMFISTPRSFMLGRLTTRLITY